MVLKIIATFVVVFLSCVLDSRFFSASTMLRSNVDTNGKADINNKEAESLVQIIKASEAKIKRMKTNKASPESIQKEEHKMNSKKSKLKKILQKK